MTMPRPHVTFRLGVSVRGRIVFGQPLRRLEPGVNQVLCSRWAVGTGSRLSLAARPRQLGGEKLGVTHLCSRVKSGVQHEIPLFRADS